MKEKLMEFYLDWVHNWLSLSDMASYYNLTTEQLVNLLDVAQDIYNEEYNK